MRLGFLGPPGTHGEQAALAYQSDSELVALRSHAAVLQAVAAGEVNEGIAAFEGSVAGCILETLDPLLNTPGLLIKHEIIERTEQHLIAAAGVKIDTVQLLITHPQAAAQCGRFLDMTLPAVARRASTSTALAVQEAVRTPGAAAIGSLRAADLAGGVVLARAIQDADDNRMRFIVIAADDYAPTGDDKTALSFKAGGAYPGLLTLFNRLTSTHLNLLNIQCRPTGRSLGEYCVFVELSEHRTTQAVRQVIADLESMTDIRCLGSFPAATPPM